MEALSVLGPALIIISLSIMLRLLNRIEEENRTLEAGLEASKMYNAALRDKTEKIRRFRHDAVGLLQAVDAYGLDDDGTLAGYGEAVRRERSTAAVPMPLLEAIVELKREQCREARIDFDCPEEFPDAWRDAGLPDETDLCLLVQNLLDNAYEANLRIADAGLRRMSFECGMFRSDDAEAGIGTAAGGADTITLQVSNRIAENEKLSFLTRKKDPGLHGIGLRIVDDIVRKYNGSRVVENDRDDHMISTRIRLETAGDGRASQPDIHRT